MNTLETLEIFRALFGKQPRSLVVTRETLDALQSAWADDGLHLVQRDKFHGENVLVMSQSDGNVRAAIDRESDRVWGVLHG